MKALQGQIKQIKNDYSNKISVGLRNKLDRYYALLKEMIKNPIFKGAQDDQQTFKITSSIDGQIQQVKKEIESQIKLQMTDYQAFLWKLGTVNQNSKPSFFKFLTDMDCQVQKTESIQTNFNFPILSFKNKQLISIASDLLETNEFCKSNYPQETILNLCYNLSAGYKITSYHNFSHAFSVFLMIYQCRQISKKLQQLYSPFQYFIVYISALAHDINHGGLNSLWEIKNKTNLATKYNNQSVLQNMHISQLFRIFRDHPQIDIVSKMKSSTQRETAKRLINRLILATDISFHQQHLKTLKDSWNQENKQNGASQYQKQILIENLFHACDIGNPCLEFQNYMNWSLLLTNQFHTQAQLEKQKGFQISPNFIYIDLKTHYKRQIGFIDFLAYPLWKQICELIPELSFLENTLTKNKEKLKKKLQSPQILEK